MQAGASSHAHDYMGDVVYPDQFHREIMPVWLVSTLEALGRRAPDLCAPYTWLDLGCGTGVSTIMAAATNPGGSFIGVDFNAEEIARARDLAAQAGVDNVRFVHASFAQWLQAPGQDLPTCDFIVAHGVYSWVATDVRQAIHRIVASALRPGGIFYVSYITHPGAVSFSAAQRLLHLSAQADGSHGAHAVRRGIDWLQRMARGGAGYFSAHDSARKQLTRLDAMDAAYLAHEFLNREWRAFHVSDVISAMDDAGCDYAGSASLLENIDALSLPAGMQPVMADMVRAGWDTAQLETARDIARNQSQRRDIYQKRAVQGNQLSMDAHRRVVMAQAVQRLPQAPSAAQLRAQPAHAELSFDTAIGPVRIAAQYLAPLLLALQDGAQRYDALARLPEYRQQPGLVSQLLQALAWMGWIHFLRPDCNVAPDVALVCDRLAELLAGRQLLGSDVYYRPVSAIGSAIAVTPER